MFICLPLIGFTQEATVKYSKDEKAIITTIIQETTGWWTRDYDKWSDAWAHKDYINWSGTNNVMHMEYNGWDELDKWVKIQDTGSMVVGSKNGKKTKELGPEFEYSSALFFFNEPKGVISTLSESKMKSRGVGPHESDPNVYVLDRDKGSYHYQDGKLMKVVVKDVVDMEMVRRQ